MTSTIKVNTVTTESGSTLTIGGCGKTVALAAGASQTGFGRTGTVDWQTSSIKTATFTAVSGEGYFCNTAGGSFTVNLPAGSAGAIVSVQDYNNTFDNNALTIDPNGTEKINGGEAGGGINLDKEGEGLTLVYVDGTVGWRSVQDNDFADLGNDFILATGGTITECGNDKIHTFTGPGTFTVSRVHPCAANNLVSYTVVGSGGAGGNSNGGGGGAGGYRELVSPSAPYSGSPLNGYPTPGNRITVTATAFPIAVGGGGPAGPNTGTSVVPGNVSTFSTITGAAGGGGGSGYGPGPHNDGANGGSAGGGGTNGGCGGTGNTPPVSPAQGTNGGAATPTSPHLGGGGGGATQAGFAYNAPSCGGEGGAGATNSITGSAVARAGGGGGGSDPSRGDRPGGTGGGGMGKPGAAGVPGVAGTTNTGGGGGGGGYLIGPNPYYAGGNGGSGIVIIRYKFK